MYSKEYLEQAHNLSSNHRKTLLDGEKCACFYCMRTYNPIEIKEWTDNNNTAICPYCDIDAVLPDNMNFPITDPDFLAPMQEYWF